MSKEELYTSREQTLVKHVVLEAYLERFAHIIGSFRDTITYVDCFSGPWNTQSDQLEDSSFAIAVAQLRQARDTHKARGRTIGLRCLFLEKDKAAFQRLQEYAHSVNDVEVRCLNRDLESAIADILAFVMAGGSASFPFIFIDPTGWSGFAMDKIGPLLKIIPGEALITFMTGHIRRFIESPDEDTQESFSAFFGSADAKKRVAGLKGIDRDDAIVQAYSENVKSTGSFTHVCSAIVLHPERDKTHFHLIYATRSPKGVEVFKDAERKAMHIMERARAEAQRRKRQGKSGQLELLGSDALHDPAYYESLRDRYTARARQRVQEWLEKQRRLSYDGAWDLAMADPLVWESDLKEWIKVWVKEDWMRVEGMKPRQWVPKRGQENFLVLNQ